MPQTPSEWLDYAGPAPVDNTVSTTGIKWAQYGPSRVITKQNTTLTIPAFNDVIPPTSNFSGFLLGYYNRQFRQFNYTAIAPFSILDLNTAVNQLNFKNNWGNAFPAIRFRVGRVMTRYIINNYWYNYFLSNNFIFPMAWPLYTGQIISPQFCIEIWELNFNPQFPTNAFNNVPMVFNTSLLNIANPPDAVPGNLSPLVNMGLNDMTLNFPQAVPIAFNPLIQWNTN